VLTARPWRHRGLLVDFPGALVHAGERAGLVAFERNVALLVGLDGDRLVGRPSFFQLDRVRKARAQGVPLRVIAHEDVLVFRVGLTSAGSEKPKGLQQEPGCSSEASSPEGPRHPLPAGSKTQRRPR
jgi:modification methylase